MAILFGVMLFAATCIVGERRMGKKKASGIKHEANEIIKIMEIMEIIVFDAITWRTLLFMIHTHHELATCKE